jgi:hypothetical protein
LALAHELNLSLSLHPEKGGGAGGAEMDVYVVDDVQLELAGAPLRPHSLFAMDLTHANQAMALAGDDPVEAIMGLDVFDEHAAIIDYGSHSLFLREEERSKSPTPR